MQSYQAVEWPCPLASLNVQVCGHHSYVSHAPASTHDSGIPHLQTSRSQLLQLVLLSVRHAHTQLGRPLHHTSAGIAAFFLWLFSALVLHSHTSMFVVVSATWCEPAELEAVDVHCKR